MNFQKKRAKSKVNILDQFNDYVSGAKNIWKPFLGSLKTFLNSLKEFLEAHPDLKGLVSIYCELLDILT